MAEEAMAEKVGERKRSGVGEATEKGKKAVDFSWEMKRS